MHDFTCHTHTIDFVDVSLYFRLRQQLIIDVRHVACVHRLHTHTHAGTLKREPNILFHSNSQSKSPSVCGET